MQNIDFEADSYDSTETVGLSLALGPTMNVGRCSCTTVLTCTCGDMPELPSPI